MIYYSTKSKIYPSKAELDELFTYDAKTGKLYNKITRSNNAKAGDETGNIDHGYIKIKINYKSYKAHRIAWIMKYGSIDENLTIDHINHNRSDNRIENLRLVTMHENNKNMPTNTSGVAGVCWNKNRKKWHARIQINKKYIHLGYFDNIKNAKCMRRWAEIILGYNRKYNNLLT